MHGVRMVEPRRIPTRQLLGRDGGATEERGYQGRGKARLEAPLAHLPLPESLAQLDDGRRVD